METELKLRFLENAGQAEFLADAWANQLIMPDSKITTEMLSRYFDTADMRMTRMKTSLRMREEGKERVATIKLGDRSRDGLHQRLEWSVTLGEEDWPDTEDCQLDITWFLKNAVSDGDPDEKLREILQQLQNQPLQEICQARFARTTFDVGYGDTLMELALDEGELRANDRTEPINEMELELREGDVRDLMDLGEELKARFQLVPEPLSKYARCLALIQQANLDHA
jgi:triphosphatase